MIAQGLAAGVGLWLMAAPAVLGYEASAASDVHRTLGPIAASVAIVAVFQATRGARRGNYLVGGLLVVVAPIVGGPLAALLNGVASGGLVALLSAFEGRRRQRMGGGWRSLFDDSLL